jgi:quercetin dioxygenase-like cupin family protein
MPSRAPASRRMPVPRIGEHPGPDPETTLAPPVREIVLRRTAGLPTLPSMTALPQVRRAVLIPVAALSLLASGVGIGVAVSAVAADDPAPVVVTRQSLAEVTSPPGAPQRTLGLSKFVVMPGTKLASHHHPGQQLGYIAEGALTYTVESGSATIMKGPGDDATVVRTIRPGQTARVRAGQWLVEEQGEVHHARNNGTLPIVIYVATLFRTGAPAAISD